MIASPELPTWMTTDVPLASVTYYGIGGKAAYFARPRTLHEVREAIAFARAGSLPLAVLGSGSNSVCADARFEGVVLSLSELNRWHWMTAGALHVEAGVTNTEIAEACLEAGRAGGGWMYRMPGLAGASVRMNARCYGGEVSQVVESVTTIDVEGRLRTWSAAEVFKGYKSTSLMESPEIVVSCVLRFGAEAARGSSLAVMEGCETDRHGKHHFDHPSCGSTFKNNYAVGKPSGRVFDELGLKGTRVGASAVSAHHANFVWNLGGATARDMLSLAALMRGKALGAGADLELEVQPVGVFDDDLYARCAMERLGPAAPAGAGHKWVGLTWHPSGLGAASSLVHGAAASLRKPGTAEVATFPRVLLSAVPEEYFRLTGAGVQGVVVALSQLAKVEDARAHPDAPFLRWETRVDAGALAGMFPLRPEAAAGSFVDGLWAFSVSEIFLAHPEWARGVDQAPYLEFEMTPGGHWVALAFEAYRARTAASAVASEGLWEGVTREALPGPVVPAEGEPDATPPVRFSMTFPWRVVEPVVALEGGRAALLAQCALSLGGGRYFLAPHWLGADEPGRPVETHCHRGEPGVKPDFHQPARYFPCALA